MHCFDTKKVAQPKFHFPEKRKLGVESLKPSVLEGDGKLRFAVFKDLWERGMYITVGLKFGADFLVYTGNFWSKSNCYNYIRFLPFIPYSS